MACAFPASPPPYVRVAGVCASSCAPSTSFMIFDSAAASVARSVAQTSPDRDDPDVIYYACYALSERWRMVGRGARIIITPHTGEVDGGLVIKISLFVFYSQVLSA